MAAYCLPEAEWVSRFARNTIQISNQNFIRASCSAIFPSIKRGIIYVYQGNQSPLITQIFWAQSRGFLLIRRVQIIYGLSGGVSVYARPKALYLFVQQKLRNFNKKKLPKNIYARFLGTVCCCSSPNKVAHVWRFTFNHKSSDGAFRPPRCSCPLNDTRNRGMGVGILRNGWGWHGAKCFHSQTRLPQDLPQPMHPPFLFTSLS